VSLICADDDDHPAGLYLCNFVRTQALDWLYVVARRRLMTSPIQAECRSATYKPSFQLIGVLCSFYFINFFFLPIAFALIPIAGWQLQISSK